jgi:small subunit ribosomal protein S5
VAHATIEGLKQLRRPEEIAASRDKPADHVIPSGTLRAYRERQREGDLFKVTEN